MKKIISIMLVCIMLFASVSLFSGCYVVNGGTMSQLKGTYELTAYSRAYTQYYKTNPNTTVDFMEENDLSLYLVIDGTQTATLAYRKNGEITCRKVSITYEYDEEETDEINKITYDAHTSANSHVYDQATLGFQAKSHKLNVSDPEYKIVDKGLHEVWRDTIRFERISKKTDLTTVNKELETTLSPLPMYLNNMIGMVGKMAYNGQSPYYGFVYRMNPAASTADVWYCLQDGDQIEEKRDVPVTFVPNGEYNDVGQFTLLDQTFDWSYSGSYTVTRSGGETEIVDYFYPFWGTIDEAISDLVPVAPAEN